MSILPRTYYLMNKHCFVACPPQRCNCYSGNGYTRCDACRGKGAIHDDTEHPGALAECSTCKGEGWVKLCATTFRGA